MTDRKKHWEQVYANKSPLEVSWYQAEPRLSLELIQRSGLGKDAPLIDVGGGASLLVDRLQAQGYRRLAVLDISARHLRWHASASAHTPPISSGTRPTSPGSAPRIPSAVARSRRVHFLTAAEDRQHYVDVLRRTLVSGGHVVIAAFAPGGPTLCSGLEIVQYDAAKLMAELGPNFHLEEQQTETHLTPAGKEQRFGFFRLRRLD